MKVRRMRFEAMSNNNADELAASKNPSIYIVKNDDGIFSIEANLEEKQTIEEFVSKMEENTASDKDRVADIHRHTLEAASKFVVPFRVYAEMFINMQKGRGNSYYTIKHYEQTIKKLEHFFGWLFLDRRKIDFTDYSDEFLVKIGKFIPFGILEDEELEAKFREFLIDWEEVCEQTVATYFRDYRAIAYWGMDAHIIRQKNIIVKTVYSDIKECYTDEEIDKLIKPPKKDAEFPEYRTWVAINWLLGTGNRIGTMINVKIKDIDFIDNMITITTQKNRRVNRIPLIENLRPIIKDYIEDWLKDENGNYISKYLFPSSYLGASSLPMTRQNMGRAISSYNKKRGVKKTSVHLFRHTFVRKWLLSGGDIHTLQRVLGHSTIDMVIHYANILGVDLRPNMENHSVLAMHKGKNRGKMIKRKNNSK